MNKTGYVRSGDAEKNRTRKGSIMIMPPRKILIATDLSPRCDRAFDRAVSLMKEFNSQLIVLHVVESQDGINSVRRIPFLPVHKPNNLLVDKAKRYLGKSINKADINVLVIVEEGNPGETILRIAREQNCDLIITGVVRKRVFDNFMLGSTIRYLLNKSEKSLLIVNELAGSSYEKILVASDYTEASRHAVETAAAFFPERHMSVLHVYSAPASYAADNPELFYEQLRPAATKRFMNFLNATDLTDQQLDRMRALVEWGVLIKLLRDLVNLSGTELVVAGSRNRGLLLNALFSKHTKRILTSLTCDILIARRPFLLNRQI